MSSRIHPQARTTPKIRQEIKDSGLSDRQAAKVFNISRPTARKWLKRDDVQDRSHRAHTLHTTLSAAQESIVLALRQSLYFPLDDLLFITRQYINPDVSRSGLARLLKREGMSRLQDVIPEAEGETIAPKTRFDSRADLQTTLMNYLKLYNHHIPQRALDAKTPVLALKEWQQKQPDLFVKRVFEQAGLDNYSISKTIFLLRNSLFRN